MHPPGTVVILSHDTGRYSDPWEALLQLQHPPGTRLSKLSGADVAYIRNQALATVRPQDEWVWFMDDDHYWDNGRLLLDLLDREVDVVQPLVVRRLPPFSPVVTRHLPNGEPYACDLHELGQTGCVPVESCGMGGTLIRRRVWEALEAPWFRVGQIVPDKLGEDVYFTRRVRAAGFSIFVDLDHPIDHCAVARLRPKWHDGAWWVAAEVGGMEICVPAARREREPCENIPAPDAEPSSTLLP